MKSEIQDLLSKTYGKPVSIQSFESTGGGCINQTQIISLTDGTSLFLKYNTHPPETMFQAEVSGLNLLQTADEGPRIPQVVALQENNHPQFLILEYVSPASPDSEFAPRFGRALAALHRVSAEQFGLDHDNYIGSTPQKNTPENNGLVFFRDHRLGFQQELARKNRLLPAPLDRQLDTLRKRLGEFLDLEGEPPALIHGDLWSENYFPATDGTPVIFDPAAHFGLREADLAMTELFGRLPQSFYDAYHESFPLPPGYPERKPLYNLYHLLNHLNLFGSSYLGSVESTVRSFIR